MKISDWLESLNTDIAYDSSLLKADFQARTGLEPPAWPVCTSRNEFQRDAAERQAKGQPSVEMQDGSSDVCRVWEVGETLARKLAEFTNYESLVVRSWAPQLIQFLRERGY